MTWSDVTADWSQWFERMQTRFPRLNPGDMPFVKLDRTRFEAYLADTHGLSLTEAREEIEDFLYLETLAREIAEPRT